MLEDRLEEAAKLIVQQARDIDELSIQVATAKRTLEASAIHSVQFWPRAWAIFGHGISAGFFFYVALILIFMAFVR